MTKPSTVASTGSVGAGNGAYEWYAGFGSAHPLEKVGFWLDYGEDDSGLFMKYLRRGSGYYIDIGASQLIIDGKIKLVAGQVSGRIAFKDDRSARKDRFLRDCPLILSTRVRQRFIWKHSAAR